MTLQVAEWEAMASQCRTHSKAGASWAGIFRVCLLPFLGDRSKMNGYRRMNEGISFPNELLLLGHLNGYLSITLSGFV